jgi:prepilin signal peptidase PulO-like enzyme (type II secretory pathway)
VNPFLIAIAWAIVGAGAGWFVRWGSVKLARLEGLEPGSKPWQVYGPPILTAILFAIFAYGIGSFPVLLLRSLFVAVLVQVIFFDLEHRLILDRVMFPAIGLALVVSLFGKPWWAGIATGIGAGLVFLLLALLGSAVFKAEAMGFGDVKLVVFIGLLLGWPQTLTGIFYGVVLAGVVSIGVIVLNRSIRGTIAYGPYLAIGALIMLFMLPPQLWGGGP